MTGDWVEPSATVVDRRSSETEERETFRLRTEGSFVGYPPPLELLGARDVESGTDCRRDPIVSCDRAFEPVGLDGSGSDWEA